LLIEMKKIGLNRLSFGVETGNEQILKAIKKGIPKEAYHTAYKLCSKHDIETRCSIIIGHPYETKKTVRETIEFACELECYQAYINIATPYPGSELLELARQGFGGIKLLTEDWAEYRRYGNSVMEMNDLTADDLVTLQKWAYRKFYLRPKIIWYNVRRAGLKAAVLNGVAFFQSVIR
ncbi:MAG: radical SAM protein, partial [Desulfobulbaceae bacterium]|nr:radical SAM protein [Desulfobulbaceae bacterium]